MSAGSTVDATAVAALAARSAVALVHYPVVDRTGKIVATAITNLDIHDIARAARTFGLRRYFLVTPVAAQRELAERILGHWSEGQGKIHNAKRSDALERVTVVSTLEDAATALGQDLGSPPIVVATGARPREGVLGERSLVARQVPDPRPLLLVFGTGWGLDESVFTRADAVLGPIRSAGAEPYNHLSVRAAVAIVCDRLFGAREE